MGLAPPFPATALTIHNQRVSCSRVGPRGSPRRNAGARIGWWRHLCRLAYLGAGGRDLLPATRRLTDKVLTAFHQACDQSDLEVAEQLLDVLEMMVRRPPPPDGKRRNMESLVAAHERLWLLRHPDHP
jgi:hypothetical protein